MENRPIIINLPQEDYIKLVRLAVEAKIPSSDLAAQLLQEALNAVYATRDKNPQ